MVARLTQSAIHGAQNSLSSSKMQDQPLHSHLKRRAVKDKSSVNETVLVFTPAMSLTRKILKYVTAITVLTCAVLLGRQIEKTNWPLLAEAIGMTEKKLSTKVDGSRLNGDHGVQQNEAVRQSLASSSPLPTTLEHGLPLLPIPMEKGFTRSLTSIEGIRSQAPQSITDGGVEVELTENPKSAGQLSKSVDVDL